MHFALESEHRQFFHSRGWIHFSDVVGSRDLEKIKSLSLTQMAKKKDPLESYEATRDLHLIDQAASGLIKDLSSVPAALWNERPLVMVGNQLISSDGAALWKKAGLPRAKEPSSERKNSYAHLKEGISLEDIWSASPLLGGMILCLEAPMPTEIISTEADSKETEEGTLKSLKPGDLLLLKSSSKRLNEPPRGGLYWLLALGSDQCRYIKAPCDPYADYYRFKGVPEGGRLLGAVSSVKASFTLRLAN